MVKTVKTVKIVSENEQGFVIINESDVTKSDIIYKFKEVEKIKIPKQKKGKRR